MALFALVIVVVNRCARELKVPITCKIRIFEDIQRTIEYAQMLERAGAKVCIEVTIFLLIIRQQHISEHFRHVLENKFKEGQNIVIIIFWCEHNVTT